VLHVLIAPCFEAVSICSQEYLNQKSIKRASKRQATSSVEFKTPCKQREKQIWQPYLLEKCSKCGVEQASIISISLLLIISKRIRTAQLLESTLYPVNSKQMNLPSR